MYNRRAHFGISGVFMWVSDSLSRAAIFRSTRRPIGCSGEHDRRRGLHRDTVVPAQLEWELDLAVLLHER